jgi:hypothetical protein
MPAPVDGSVHHRGEGRPKGAKGAATGVEAADRVRRIGSRANPDCAILALGRFPDTCKRIGPLRLVDAAEAEMRFLSQMASPWFSAERSGRPSSPSGPTIRFLRKS